MRLFLHELAEVCDAEQQILKVLPNMARNAINPDLQATLEMHIEETRRQLERIEEVFQSVQAKPQTRPSLVMQAILRENDNLLKRKVGDAGLIAAARQIEHFEIAAYNSLYSWARLLRNQYAASLLHHSLLEERMADEMLATAGESTLYLPREQKRELAMAV